MQNVSDETGRQSQTTYRCQQLLMLTRESKCMFSPSEKVCSQSSRSECGIISPRTQNYHQHNGYQESLNSTKTKRTENIYAGFEKSGWVVFIVNIFFLPIFLLFFTHRTNKCAVVSCYTNTQTDLQHKLPALFQAKL